MAVNSHKQLPALAIHICLCVVFPLLVTLNTSFFPFFYNNLFDHKISNRSTIAKILASGERIERDYDGRADPNEGGSCVDGWWIFMNESKSTGANVVKADANFGLRTLGNNPRDA